MDSDEPTGWPEDGYGGDGEPPELGPPQDDSLSDGGMAYDVGGDETPDGDAAAPESPAEPDFGDTADASGYDLDSEPGELADDQLGADDLAADDGAEPTDPAPGIDPDADPLADDESWQRDPFPQALDLDAPEPVDGMPWSDPSVLGEEGGELPSATAGAEGSPPASDLYAYDGSEPPADGSDPWGSLSRSEDPATSSLARFWGPGS